MASSMWIMAALAIVLAAPIAAQEQSYTYAPEELQQQKTAVAGGGVDSSATAAPALSDRAPQEAVVAAEGADDIVPEPVFAFTASRTIDAGVAAALPGADSAYGGGYGDYGYGAYGAYGGYGGYGGDGVVVEEEAPSNATLAEATPYTFGFRFVGMDFDALVADAPKLAAFKLGVRGSVANATGLTLASVFVANVTRGSVVADVVIYAPNSWSPQQVNDMAQLLTTSPASVFTASFLASYPDITGFEVTALSQLPALPAAGLTRDAKIGIGVGVGGGGAALLAAGTIIFVVARRRRRMAVEPRNLAGADVELDA